MTGDTVVYNRGSTFEMEGQFKDLSGDPQPLTGIQLLIAETGGFGMQSLAISATDELLGKFVVQLPVEEATKLPLGRSSWFKIKFKYVGSSDIVFPPVWLDTR